VEFDLNMFNKINMTENTSNDQLSQNIIFRNDKHVINRLVGHNDVMAWCNWNGVLTIKHPNNTYTYKTKNNKKLFAVSISKEHDIVAIGGRQNKLVLLDLYCSVITEFDVGFLIRNIEFIGYNVVVCGQDGNIIIYDFLNFKLLKTLVGHKGTVYGIASNEKILITCDAHGFVIFWNVQTFEKKTSFQLIHGRLWDVVINKKHKSAIFASNNMSCIIVKYDKDYKIIKQTMIKTGNYSCYGICTFGDLLFCCTFRGFIYTINISQNISKIIIITRCISRSVGAWMSDIIIHKNKLYTCDSLGRIGCYSGTITDELNVKNKKRIKKAINKNFNVDIGKIIFDYMFIMD